MSIMARRGKCYSCGHDHGDGTLWASIAVHEPCRKEADELRAALSARDEQIAALREALEKYGIHTYTCQRRWKYTPDGTVESNECTCGLSAALEARGDYRLRDYPDGIETPAP